MSDVEKGTGPELPPVEVMPERASEPYIAILIPRQVAIDLVTDFIKGVIAAALALTLWSLLAEE